MSDLISRAAVLSLPRAYAKNARGKIFKEFINVKDIEALPAAQPELVRCKYCKWYGKVDKMFYRKNTCTNPRVQMKPSPMDYCSEGRRRKNNG